MIEWKDISLAPRDGTPIQIWDGEMQCTACWQQMGRLGGTWRGIGASGWECENDFLEPTHFHELLDPPK